MTLVLFLILLPLKLLQIQAGWGGVVALAGRLREEDIGLALDFVFNHTSDEHTWAKKARSGDPDYLNYYFTYPDRELPDQFQKYLRDIFPTVRRGSFTWNEEMQRWV
jgi:amylosucrase